MMIFNKSILLIYTIAKQGKLILDNFFMTDINSICEVMCVLDCVRACMSVINSIVG